MSYSLKSLAVLSLSASAIALSGAHAQGANQNEADNAEEAAVQDVVIVKGIRGSQQRALDTKKNAEGFVDAISAEDVGKLPDQNIAEALQRVTGVSISRARGEGDFVSIRGLGPNFVRGTINNRTLVSTTESRDGTRSGGFESSTGRETNFDILPAETISNLEVIKSPSASDVEGGIGGVVNIETHRPLLLGNRVTVSAKGTYRDLNEELDPSASGLFSWANPEGNFGLLGAISYSERSILDANSDSFGYATFGPAVDTNADGTGDLTGASFPFSFNPSSFEEERERITLQATAEYEMDQNNRFIFDVLYSDRDLQSRGAVSIVGTCCGFFGNVNGNGVTNADGSIQIPELQTVGDSAQSYGFTSQIQNNTDDQSVQDDLLSLGGKWEHSNENWDIGVDLAYSTAGGELLFERTSLQTLNNVPFLLNISGDRVNVELQPGGSDLTNIASYRTNNADIVERFNDDDELSLAFDASRNLDSNVLTAIKFGARYRTREVEREDRTTFNVNTDQIIAPDLGANGVFTVGDFSPGGGYPFDQLLFGDVATQQALLAANNPATVFESVFSAPQSFGIEEDTLAAYVQADLGTEIGGVPVTGNFGVRIVQTQTDVTGFFQPFRIDNDASNNNLGTIVVLDPAISEDVTENDYLNILPSLNLKAELADDLFLRFSAGKSVTRPTFLELAPGLSGINPTQRFANSGNPNLQAYESTNIDIGLEWYLDDASALYGAVFVKDIEEFIGVSTNLDVDAFGVNFNSLSQPLNQGNANITGIELGGQYAFDNGFGFIANLTLIDSEAEFTEGVNAGDAIPFTGVSEVSYNLTGYYERGGFNARLAYAYRDDFVFLASDVFGNTLINNDYGQLDGSVSYSFDDRWTVFGNLINLTDEANRLFSDTTARPVSYSEVGRRFEIGVRASF